MGYFVVGLGCFLVGFVIAAILGSGAEYDRESEVIFEKERERVDVYPNFANTILELNKSVEHIPTCIILAHMHHFHGVRMDVLKGLWQEYNDAGSALLMMILEYADKEGITVEGKDD